MGTSSSETRIAAPKHSAASERSIRLTAAAASVRSATRAMPLACASLSEISSRTLIPMSCTAGNESTGMAFFTGDSRSASSHSFILRFILPPCQAVALQNATAASAALAASGV